MSEDAHGRATTEELLAHYADVDGRFDEAERYVRENGSPVDQALMLPVLRLQRAHEKCFFGQEPCGLRHA